MENTRKVNRRYKDRRNKNLVINKEQEESPGHPDFFFLNSTERYHVELFTYTYCLTAVPQSQSNPMVLTKRTFCTSVYAVLSLH